MTKEDTIPETALEIEDLEIEREIVNIDFEIGDNVVYPHHGAGQVIKKEEKNILGEVREYLTIKILHNDMTVMVPCENAGKAGLRRVIDEETVKAVLAVLAADVSEMPKNWNRRFKHNRDKIKTGDILELAEVVRNLAIREQDKGLSTGEKQMYTRAKKILASELMYALDKDEEEAEAHLDDLLLVHAQRVHELRRQDLLGAGEHLLLAGREPLLGLANGEVAHHFGEFVDIARLDFVPVVLEAPVPVLGHLRHVVPQHIQDLLDGLLVDDAAQAGLAGVAARNHDRHVVVEDLDGEVLLFLTEDLLALLLEDLAGPVMGIDDVVADLEVDALRLNGDLEVLDLLFDYFGDDCLLVSASAARAAAARVYVCRYRSTRLISCKRRRPSRMSFARISPTPSTVSSSASVAASISSSRPNSRTISVTTSFGSRGMRPRMR